MSTPPADWWQAEQPWIAVAITYSGLVARGVREDSLQSFPEAFRVGMAARADQLVDHGENDPRNCEPPFGNGVTRIGISVFSDSEETAASHNGLRAAALRGTRRPHGADGTGLWGSAWRPEPSRIQRFDWPARDRGLRRRAVARPRAGNQSRRVHPRVSRGGRRLRKYQSRVGAFNRFLQAHARTDVASTASRRSTCCAAASTSSCPPYRRSDGSAISPELETMAPRTGVGRRT
jgi:hypothetical protein